MYDAVARRSLHALQHSARTRRKACLMMITKIIAAVNPVVAASAATFTHPFSQRFDIGLDLKMSWIERAQTRPAAAALLFFALQLQLHWKKWQRQVQQLAAGRSSLNFHRSPGSCAPRAARIIPYLHGPLQPARVLASSLDGRAECGAEFTLLPALHISAYVQDHNLYRVGEAEPECDLYNLQNIIKIWSAWKHQFDQSSDSIYTYGQPKIYICKL